MARDDWFRRTTWSEHDREEFLRRNRRSRGDFRKAQYVRVQAVTLCATEDPSLVRAALDLLVEQYFPFYVHCPDCAGAYCCAAECCELLGRVDEAVEFYRTALLRERRLSSTTAPYALAKLAVEHDRLDLAEE